MKKVLIALFLGLLCVPNAQAVPSCGTSLMPAFTSNQANQLCKTFGSAVSQSLIPSADNTYDLGSAALRWKTGYFGTSLQYPMWTPLTSAVIRAEADPQRLFTFDGASDTALTLTFGDGGTTAAQILSINSATADADDDSTLCLAGGGTCGSSSRGAFSALYGNEHATLAGQANLVTGNISGADLKFNTNDDIFFNTLAEGNLFIITDAGNIVATGSTTTTGLNFPAANFETVAGAGSTVSDAAALSATKHVHQITGANGTLGWKFASATAGQFEVLLNTTAGVAKVYAVAGGTCNGGSADAACTLLSGIAPHLCYATAANAWICS